jgi:hypothetical protein
LNGLMIAMTIFIARRSSSGSASIAPAVRCEGAGSGYGISRHGGAVAADGGDPRMRGRLDAYPAGEHPCTPKPPSPLKGNSE